MNDHFGGDYRSYGGTHSSIEQTWRAKGGQAYATKLIDDVEAPDGRVRQVMFAEARQYVIARVSLLNSRDRLTNDD